MISQGNARIGYADLFAGRGWYRDGTPSTPPLVLGHAIREGSVGRRLVSLFNDADPDTYEHLRKDILSLPGIGTLTYAPTIRNAEVNGELAEMLAGMELIPTLSFLDPWGYKVVSLSLVRSVLKDWGSDCIFFFNYNRINMGIHNQTVRDDLDALLGKGESRKLEKRVNVLSPRQRESEIMGQVVNALRMIGGEYTLPFRFIFSHCNRTSHFLIFVTKHPLGYKIMKDVMANESSFTIQGVPSFEYNPHREGEQAVLPGVRGPLDELEDTLPADFAGEVLKVEDIFARHNVGKPYVLANYKAVIRSLEDRGRVIVAPPAGERRKNTLPDWVEVKFPGCSRRPLKQAGQA